MGHEVDTGGREVDTGRREVDTGGREPVTDLDGSLGNREIWHINRLDYTKRTLFHPEI